MHLAFPSRVIHCALLALGVVLCTPGGVSAGLAMPAESAAVVAPSGVESNSLDVRQFHIDNAHIPAQSGLVSARQSVIAWQVTQGTWNGQTLDGLCLVLVESHSEAGSAHQTNCYISHEATAAQREALLGAFVATQPQLLSPHDLDTLRLEAAVITLEVEGQTVVLHLGLIS